MKTNSKSNRLTSHLTYLTSYLTYVRCLLIPTLHLTSNYRCKGVR